MCKPAANRLLRYWRGNRVFYYLHNHPSSYGLHLIRKANFPHFLRFSQSFCDYRFQLLLDSKLLGKSCKKNTFFE